MKETTMPQEMKTLLQRMYDEAFNQGKMDVLDEMIADDYIRHQPPYATVKGKGDYKKFVTDVRRGYTGFNIAVEETIITGDVSVVRVILSGKHTGQTPTVQASPTGKQVSMTGCTISHWKDGKIVEEWAHNDYLGLTQQFGVVPPPGLY
jgi:predicted ester cyclase